MQNRIEYDGRVFAHDQILSGNCYRARSLLASSLTIDTFSIDVESTDTSLLLFTVDAPLIYYDGTTRVGTFFVQNVERTARNTYHISCVSAIGLLDKRDHYGGIYTGQTVADVVADICGGVSVTVASNIAHIKLYGWLPIASRRANLAQVLFAISAAVTEDAAGALQIGGLERQVSGSFPEDAVFLGGTVEYGSPAVQVVVTEHQYIKSEEEQKLFEGTTLNGDRITFSEPMHSLSASGFTILSSGENYAVVSSGSGTLTGKKYTHATREVIGQRETAQAAQLDASENTVRVTDATLVSMANSRAVADRLAEYYAHAERVREDVILTGQKAGDVVRMTHPYDLNLVTACVESLDINLSGLARAAATALVGYIPPDITQIEYYDTFELLTGSGTWTPPDGAKSVRVVLIGGGSGGTHGLGGSKSSGSSPGSGGAPGEPGTGGNVVQSDLSIDQATSFPYACGAGGAGRENGDTTPNGGSTTFGDLTTADGSPSDFGYENLLDGTRYALPGKAGCAGGKGGNGGGTSYGEDGESITFNGQTWNGGHGGAYDSGQGARAGGGGGGGAAVGAKGWGGGQGFVTVNGDNTHSLQGGSGGKGGSAVTSTRTLTYGCGGDAGCGGGGAGGVGSFQAGNLPVAVGINGNSGRGGSGAAGQAGADGCIFVFYSLPRKEE